MMEEQETIATTSTVTAGTTIIAFLAGAAAGAGLALLLAPRTGHEVRERIRGMAGEAMDKTKEYMSTMQGKAKEMMAQGKEAAQRTAEEAERTTH